MTTHDSTGSRAHHVPRKGPNRLLGLIWAGFASAAVVGALIVPAHILVQGVLGPLGVPSFDRHYGTFARALSDPLVKIYLLVLFACSFYMLAFRVWYVVRELGVPSKLGVGVVSFGLSGAGLVIAGYLLFTGP